MNAQVFINAWSNQMACLPIWKTLAFRHRTGSQADLMKFQKSGCRQFERQVL
jgi:hypothetical protein